MNVHQFIEQVKKQRYFDDQIVHVQELSSRGAAWGEVPGGLHPALQKQLADEGVKKLYSHQAETVRLVREGLNPVVVTGTASGKTLCYNIPVVEKLAEEPGATALYLFPTKALAQDQLRGLARLLKVFDAASAKPLAGVYDGDTPANLRRRLRDGASVILTNPDMLHQGLLPQHARWSRFFSKLRFLVIDELHAYRGVFGSHLANVLRRLFRVCRQYGAAPQIICCSATIGNPREHAEAITGHRMDLVSIDGAPRGPKSVVLWNPPPIETAAAGDPSNWRVGGNRRSALREASQLMAGLVREGIQTISFVRTRLAAELLYKNCRDMLRNVSPALGNTVHAYRGGYLPEERRAIEQRLVKREILGISSTSALELGIDIGSLDACILVGYPGSVASFWQRSGRAGRGFEDAVVFLVGMNAPMDQYLMLHSDYLFRQNPEQAIVDPDNPHVTLGHIQCAMHEMPLKEEELALFGPVAPQIASILEGQEAARHRGRLWYHTETEPPAPNVSLRNMAGPVYTIQEDSGKERVIGTMDEVTALSQLFTHAVYLHGAETYFVNKLDLEEKVAFVEKKDLDYYTQSVQTSEIRVDEVFTDTCWPEPGETQPPIQEAESAEYGRLGFGDVTVTTTIPMFKKIRFHSRDSLGFEKLELPPQQLETVAMWLCMPESVESLLNHNDILVAEALLGVSNVFVEVAPMFLMCDPQDIGTVVDSSCFRRHTLFVHDRYPGGMGYAERCLDRLDEILPALYDVVRDCSCQDGCPSCVGSPIPPFAMTDLDAATRGRIPNKQGARILLERILLLRSS